MPTIDVNGETIHYERAGKGPTLAFFHSLGTNSYLWERQIARWSDRFTCVAFDARGHGRSTNNGGATMQAIAEDAHAALKALGLLPTHLIGISMGGLQCARFHALAPADIKSIVYADSFAHLGEAGPARVEALSQKVRSMSMQDYAVDYMSTTLLAPTPQADKDALVAAIAGMTADNYVQTVKSVFTEDVREQLKGIRCPTHVVVGAKDERTPPAASETVRALVPGATMKVIPDAAHLSNIDNPAGFNAAVEPFLAQVT